jgi:anti-sigma factor RsiW
MTRERHPRGDLTALLDGALAAGRAAEVQEHLSRCPSCREEEARLRGAVAALGALPPAPDLPPFFGARLDARLREEHERARRPRLPRWLVGVAGAIPHPRLALAGGVAAVAAAAVVAGVAVHSVRERDTRAMLRDLDLLQDYETASAVGVDTPEDAVIVAQLDQLEREEGKP